MQINPNSNYKYQTPNFKAISLVQIPRKAFKNPENIKECSQIFGDKARQISGEKVKGAFGALLAMFFPSLIKSITILENFSHSYAKLGLQSNNIDYPLSWFKMNSGLEIPEAKDENYHSFFVYTKKDKKNVMKATIETARKIKDYLKEGTSKYSGSNSPLLSTYATAKMGIDTDKIIAELTKDTPIKTFQIGSVDQLPQIAKELDF